MFKRFAFSATVAVLILLFFQSFSQAQGLIKDPFDGAVIWKVSVAEAKPYAVGNTVTLVFEATVAPHFHLFSVQPPDKNANLPTVIQVSAATKGAKADGKLTEEGKRIEEYDEIFETSLRYFHDKATFKQKFTVTKKEFTLDGELSYQVCDESGMCTSQKQTFRIVYP